MLTCVNTTLQAAAGAAGIRVDTKILLTARGSPACLYVGLGHPHAPACSNATNTDWRKPVLLT